MPGETDQMTIEANKKLVRRFIDEVFVGANQASIDEMVTPDFAWHVGDSATMSRAEFKQATKRVSGALNDVSFTIEDEIAEGDRVAVRLTASATQVGEFMKIPPSGKSYKVTEIHIFRIEDGKIAEHWHEFDRLGIMQQLGHAAKTG